MRVAIVDAYDSPTIASDIATYAARNGDQAYRAGQFRDQPMGDWTHTDTSDTGCGAAGWYGEQSLDIEAVHAMAPDAGITYVGASSCYDDDLIAALDTIVDQRSATIVSNSWGEPELASDPRWTPSTTSCSSAGRSRASASTSPAATTATRSPTPAPSRATCPPRCPGSPRSAAPRWRWAGTGATSSRAAGAPTSSPCRRTGSRGPRSATSTARVAGPARVRRSPGTSAGSSPLLSGATAGAVDRVVPDIAADGDPTTGFLVGQSETWPDGSIAYGEYRIGGTSLASPLIAGVQALAQQAAGHPLGFANPAIYARYGTAAYHDVVDPKGQLGNVRVDFVNGLDASGGLKYSVRSFGDDSSLKATTGYDDVTGVGSPTAFYLLSYLNSRR
ncbi:S8 family serine peptidase [Streptacidiphilus monticola]